jgi:hypothetical protein
VWLCVELLAARAVDTSTISGRGRKNTTLWWFGLAGFYRKGFFFQIKGSEKVQHKDLSKINSLKLEKNENLRKKEFSLSVLIPKEKMKDKTVRRMRLRQRRHELRRLKDAQNYQLYMFRKYQSLLIMKNVVLSIIIMLITLGIIDESPEAQIIPD